MGHRPPDAACCFTLTLAGVAGHGGAQGRPQAWQLAAESASEVDDWLESLEEVGAVVVAQPRNEDG